jgi:hypothetical protein
MSTLIYKINFYGFDKTLSIAKESTIFVLLDLSGVTN